MQISEENERALQERKVAAEDRQESKQERAFAQNDRDSIFYIHIKMTNVWLVKKRIDILDWLSSGDFHSRHEKIGESHTEGTGNWLITELQSWFDGNDPHVIICKGAGISSLKITLLILRWCRKDLFDVSPFSFLVIVVKGWHEIRF